MFPLSFVTKKSSSKIQLFLFLFFLLFLAQANSVKADCSCSIGSSGITNIGLALQATTCPNETGSYVYDFFFAVSCNGSLVYQQPSQDYDSGTPEEMIALYSDNDDIVLRNPSGTHIIKVQKGGTYSFNGTIARKNTASLSPGVYEANPGERLNQYCSSFTPLADGDNDGFPDCLDCIPDNSTNEHRCTLPPNNLGKCLK